MLRVLLFVVLTSCLAQAQATNGTANGADAQCPINIPGFAHHGNCNLFCRPATWTDIIIFYLGNYIAHAVTVISSPGQSVMRTFLTIMSSLLFPASGISKGLDAIFSLAKFAKTDLQVAARAGALCAVIRIPYEEEEDPAPPVVEHEKYDRPPAVAVGDNGNTETKVEGGEQVAQDLNAGQPSDIVVSGRDDDTHLEAAMAESIPRDRLALRVQEGKFNYHLDGGGEEVCG